MHIDGYTITVSNKDETIEYKAVPERFYEIYEMMHRPTQVMHTTDEGRVLLLKTALRGYDDFINCYRLLSDENRELFHRLKFRISDVEAVDKKEEAKPETPKVEFQSGEIWNG